VRNINEFVKKTMVLPTQEPQTEIRVDFIFSSTPYERQAIENTKKIMIRNAYVNFASLEDTIIHKIFAGRTRDIEDVRGMLLKNPNVDVKYIRKWLKEFDKSLKENFLKIFEKLLSEI